MEAVYDHLVTVLTDKFEVDAEHIRPDVTLADLELDSLALVELYVTLQEHWGTELEEDEAAADLTLEEFARVVQEQVSGGPAPTAPGTPR
ncbi:acyl carrier protein [Streptomyces sp. NPDC053560]|uniref:acyl carrier protein n=1 Tax=Streptomyces sp. NPDC053560 TaxID=3365711 RepID=UPI0037D00416